MIVLVGRMITRFYSEESAGPARLARWLNKRARGVMTVAATL